jgi:hypothetical protein
LAPRFDSKKITPTRRIIYYHTAPHTFARIALA